MILVYIILLGLVCVLLCYGFMTYMERKPTYRQDRTTTTVANQPPEIPSYPGDVTRLRSRRDKGSC